MLTFCQVWHGRWIAVFDVSGIQTTTTTKYDESATQKKKKTRNREIFWLFFFGLFFRLEFLVLQDCRLFMVLQVPILVLNFPFRIWQRQSTSQLTSIKLVCCNPPPPPKIFFLIAISSNFSFFFSFPNLHDRSCLWVCCLNQILVWAIVRRWLDSAAQMTCKKPASLNQVCKISRHLPKSFLWFRLKFFFALSDRSFPNSIFGARVPEKKEPMTSALTTQQLRARDVSVNTALASTQRSQPQSTCKNFSLRISTDEIFLSDKLLTFDSGCLEIEAIYLDEDSDSDVREVNTNPPNPERAKTEVVRPPTPARRIWGPPSDLLGKASSSQSSSQPRQQQRPLQSQPLNLAASRVSTDPMTGIETIDLTDDFWNFRLQ